MTKKQHDFCVAYVECRNPREASITAGYTESFSKTKSYALLKNPAIKDKITTLSESYYKNQFDELGLKAIKSLSDVIENTEAPSTQLSSIKYVLGVIGVTDKPSGTGIIESGIS